MRILTPLFFTFSGIHPELLQNHPSGEILPIEIYITEYDTLSGEKNGIYGFLSRTASAILNPVCLYAHSSQYHGTTAKA
jgi:hypothetical protein